MEISCEDLRSLGLFAANDPHLTICIEAILQKVVFGPPVMERCKKRLKHEVIDIFSQEWRSFAQKALRHILIAGFFAWGIVRRQSKRWPEVLDLGTYSLIVEAEFPRNISLGESPRGAILCLGFGYDPTVKGDLLGLGARARKMCLYAKSLREDSRDLERRRMRPKLFAELSELPAEIEGVDFDWYAGDGERFERNELEVADLLQKRKMLIGEKETDGEVTVLPRGQKLRPIPVPTGRSDLAQILRNVEINIYSMFSVPRHLYAVPTNTRASDVAPQYFTDACYQWGQEVQTFLSKTFHRVYAEEIKGLARKGGEVDTLQTVVYFEQTSPMEGSELRRLYEEGVLTWDTYAKHSLRKAGVRQKITKEPEEPEAKEPKEKKRKLT